MAGSVKQLAGWMPIRSYWQNGQSILDWCYVGEQRFTHPFLEHTIDIILKRPFNVTFRHQTSLETLAEFSETCPGMKPTAFIFHVSRCGSTLLTQMFGSLRRNLTASEPSVLHMGLRCGQYYKAFSDDQRIAILQWLISAIGQKRFGEENGYFVKFSSWAALDLPLIRRAFPDVPSVFVYRDPVSVIVSNLKEKAGKAIPGGVDPAIIGLDVQTVMTMRLEEYLAIVIGRFCEAALAHLDDQCMLINHSQLPDVVWKDLLPFFGLDYSAEEIETMKSVSRFNAKRPETLFVDDSEAKRLAASDIAREMADKWSTPAYEKLEALRLSRLTTLAD